MANSGENQTKEQIVEEKPTLYDYIEENHKLITTLGVFTALTLFAKQTIPDYIGSLLSALFLTLTLLVWLELVGRFPPKMGTSTMYWFESVLSFSVLAIIIYWFLSVRSVLPWLTMFITFFLVISIISASMKKFDLFNKLFRAKPNEKRVLRYILGIILVGLAGGLSILAASAATLYIDPWIDSLLK